MVLLISFDSSHRRRFRDDDPVVIVEVEGWGEGKDHQL